MLVLLVFSCAGVANAQTRTLATLRGQVVAPGRPNADAIEVQLEMAPNRLIGRTGTDGSGLFEFHGLEAGRYDVIIQLDGYLPVRQSVEVESRIQTPDFVDDPDAEIQRAVVDTGVLDQASAVYIVLTPDESAGADPEFEELRRKYPRKILQDYERAQEDSRKGDVTRAMQRYEALLEEAPDFYRAYNDLGILYQKQQKYRDAERVFNVARTLNAEVAQPLINLGALYLQEADESLGKDPDSTGAILDEALDILEEAIQIEPEAANAYYLLGNAYFKSDFLEEAESNLNRAIEIQPSMLSARLMRINVHLRWEKWESALALIDEYLSENPNASNRAQLQDVRLKVLANLEASR